jgi:cyclohexa-1,5-dienecarbonyl-CoA hydratase
VTGAGGIHYEARDGVGHVVLDAPPLNVLTGALMDQLAAALGRARADRSLVAVAVTARGKAFSAGADVGEHRPEQAPEMIASFGRLFQELGSLDLPIVMAVGGAALGAGFELALMADVLLAAESASFGQPEIRLGFFAPVAVAWLSRRIGPARAVEVTSTGRAYSAAEMAAMGLVSRVVPPERLEEALAEVLADLRRASPAVMRLNVRLVRQLSGLGFELARHEAERVFLGELLALEDPREGIAAFYEKRRPAWRNG